MKKSLVLLALAAFCFTNADAQKQIGGDKTIEAEFTPFGSTPISNYGIRGRLFTSETMAIRAQVNIATSKSRDVIGLANTQPFLAPEDDRLNPELYSTVRSSYVGIMPGIEFHTDGTDNLSPYIGGVLDIGFGSDSQEDERWGPNDIDNVADYEKWVQWSETWSRSWSRFGIGAVLGFDYYFVDNLYMGAEIMVGFGSMKYNEWEYEVTDDVAYSLAYSGFTDDNIDALPTDWNQTMTEFGAPWPSPYASLNPDGDGTLVAPFERDGNGFGMNAQGTIRLGWIIVQ